MGCRDTTLHCTVHYGILQASPALWFMPLVSIFKPSLLTVTVDVKYCIAVVWLWVAACVQCLLLLSLTCCPPQFGFVLQAVKLFPGSPSTTFLLHFPLHCSPFSPHHKKLPQKVSFV